MTQPPTDNFDGRLDAAVALLSQLIAIQSFSREEDKTADLISEFLEQRGAATQRIGNNIWAVNKHFATGKPTILMHSHHDTVRPNRDWTRDPFKPQIDDGKLYGLGSNDAGASLVCLALTFLRFFERADLPFNLVYGAGAEEESAGEGGISLLQQHIPPIDAAIIGEPTEMEAAVGEKGLLVLDCTAHGRSGHAARNVGVNAIEIAMRDVKRLGDFRFERRSELLGDVKTTVTQIKAGTQHNVVPDRCEFVVDVRVTDVYTLEEVITTLQDLLESEVRARSLRLRSSSIDANHPLVRAAQGIGLHCFGSPTMSDQALLTVPSLKIGPGRSQRSHTADEYVEVEELRLGLQVYEQLLHALTREF